jgi:hypothetical protein
MAVLLTGGNYEEGSFKSLEIKRQGIFQFIKYEIDSISIKFRELR